MDSRYVAALANVRPARHDNAVDNAVDNALAVSSNGKADVTWGDGGIVYFLADSMPANRP